MSSNLTLPLYRKIIVCLVAGLVSGASFNRLASRFLGHLLPGVLIDPLTVMIMVVPVAYAIFWHFKKVSPERNDFLMVFWLGVIRFVVAFDLSTFGWFKLYHLQFWVPMEKLDEPFGSISSQWLTWMFFARSYPMDFIIGVFQIVGSFLLLFSRTRMVGVFVTLPILLNVFLIGLFYDMGLVVIHSGIMLMAVVYLLFQEYSQLKEFFFNNLRNKEVVKINTGIKAILRISLAAVPLIFIYTHETADKHPELKGKYEVEKLLINNTDFTHSINCDSVLSIVYLEVGNTCILQFKDYKQRLMGLYDYKKSTNQFNVEWLDQKSSPKLEATLVSKGNKRMRLFGRIGKNVLDAELIKK